MYDMEDLEYYTEEAIKDLDNTGFAPCRAGAVVKVGNDIYLLKRVYGESCHRFLKLVGNVKTLMETIIIMGNGYRVDWDNYPAPLFRADAIKLMEMGVIVAHERYYKVKFKMVDGKMYDHWEDKDEPDEWFDFDPSNYSYPDTLTNDQYVGWYVTN